MSSWTDRMPPLGKKRTGFGPHPESEHPGQTRLECRSRTAISCDSHERREQHFRRPAEKADRFWSARSEEHTSELQSRLHLVCRLLLEKKKARSSPLTCPRSSRGRRPDL